MINLQVYTSVRVKDDTMERHGQVGTFVGAGRTPDESAVKFEASDPTAHQEVEYFKDDQLEAV